jgi:hypothetical protein
MNCRKTAGNYRKVASPPKANMGEPPFIGLH